eukprot:351088-Chlamydomonas_euryale.AAC.2
MWLLRAAAAPAPTGVGVGVGADGGGSAAAGANDVAASAFPAGLSVREGCACGLLLSSLLRWRLPPPKGKGVHPSPAQRDGQAITGYCRQRGRLTALGCACAAPRCAVQSVQTVVEWACGWRGRLQEALPASTSCVRAGCDPQALRSHLPTSAAASACKQGRC